MLTIEPPAGRRTARAAFDVDVLVGPALPEDDLLAPAFAGVGVTVGAADEEFDGEATALLPMVEVVAQFDVAGAG